MELLAYAKVAGGAVIESLVLWLLFYIENPTKVEAPRLSHRVCFSKKVIGRFVIGDLKDRQMSRDSGKRKTAEQGISVRIESESETV